MAHYAFKASPYSSHSQILDRFPAPGNGRRVLDVGCGNGYLGAILAERGYDVTGVERPGGLTDRFPENVRLIEADLEGGLPVEGRFHTVLCADILEHLRDPLALLRQVRDLLEPGGELVASLPNSGNLYFRLTVMAGRFPQHDKGLFDRTHVRFYTWDGWRELFEQAGLPIEQVWPTGIPVGLAAPQWEGSVVMRAAEACAYGAARLRKQLFAYQFVVTARAVTR
ncbi:MAG: class I SAM-dependent methyltransferase [Bryobacteraceae bacterium]